MNNGCPKKIERDPFGGGIMKKFILISVLGIWSSNVWAGQSVEVDVPSFYVCMSEKQNDKDCLKSNIQATELGRAHSSQNITYHFVSVSSGQTSQSSKLQISKSNSNTFDISIYDSEKRVTKILEFSYDSKSSNLDMGEKKKDCMALSLEHPGDLDTAETSPGEVEVYKRVLIKKLVRLNAASCEFIASVLTEDDTKLSLESRVELHGFALFEIAKRLFDSIK